MDFSIKNEIINWNNRFPLDRWYREKYKISYLSKDHRESSFYAQLFEFKEDEIYNEFRNRKEKERTENKFGTKSWWSGKEATEKDIDDWFNSPL
jgi:hypothetical protein